MQEGRIGDYAKYQDLGDASRYVLIVYNKEGDIEAILSEGTERTNLKTHQADSVTNYKGRGAIGVIIKE